MRESTAGSFVPNSFAIFSPRKFFSLHFTEVSFMKPIVIMEESQGFSVHQEYVQELRSGRGNKLA